MIEGEQELEKGINDEVHRSIVDDFLELIT
jgi:hypothetical protein